MILRSIYIGMSCDILQLWHHKKSCSYQSLKHKNHIQWNKNARKSEEILDFLLSENLRYTLTKSVTPQTVYYAYSVFYFVCIVKERTKNTLLLPWKRGTSPRRDNNYSYHNLYAVLHLWDAFSANSIWKVAVMLPHAILAFILDEHFTHCVCEFVKLLIYRYFIQW